jgi:hypothetical protein
MSVKRKILTIVLVLAIIVIGAYVLISSQPNQRGGEEASPLQASEHLSFFQPLVCPLSSPASELGTSSAARSQRGNRMKAAREAKKA